MLTAKQKLDELKYNPKYKNNNIVIYIWDRILKDLVKLQWNEVIKSDQFSFELEILSNGLYTICEIPYHRVMRICINSNIIWERTHKINALDEQSGNSTVC